jgi:hypothetical protein
MLELLNEFKVKLDHVENREASYLLGSKI